MRADEDLRILHPHDAVARVVRLAEARAVMHRVLAVLKSIVYPLSGFVELLNPRAQR